MTPYIIGAVAGPFIGLAVGFVVAWFDPDGRLQQARRNR